ncbi:hypothetical protein PYCC9005_002845 [Savitreella phatthalungensis]
MHLPSLSAILAVLALADAATMQKRHKDTKTCKKPRVSSILTPSRSPVLPSVALSVTNIPPSASSSKSLALTSYSSSTDSDSAAWISNSASSPSLPAVTLPAARTRPSTFKSSALSSSTGAGTPSGPSAEVSKLPGELMPSAQSDMKVSQSASDTTNLFANPKSQPGVPTSGLASTTTYQDGGKNACGCYVKDADFGMKLSDGTTLYQAAGSPGIFGTTTWLGQGCGLCYELTSTGKAPDNAGLGSKPGTKVKVLITNLCPDGGPSSWCTKAGVSNLHGYKVHFDMSTKTRIFNGDAWDNPVVQYNQIQCPKEAIERMKTCGNDH